MLSLTTSSNPNVSRVKLLAVYTQIFLQVTIHKTGKISQSSNVVGTTHYTLEFDSTADWTNTLMGWNGVADTMDQLRNRFRFETPAEAIYFCETNGAFCGSCQ